MLVDDYLLELSTVLAKSPLLLDDISDADSLIKNIECLSKTDTQQTQLVGFKRLLEKLKLELLFGATGQTTNKELGWQKSKDRLSLLLKSREQLLDCEQIGKHTLDQLASQEETIIRATKKTQETNDNLSWSNRLANKMNSIFR